jgi:hypothetical protein
MNVLEVDYLALFTEETITDLSLNIFILKNKPLG